MVLKPILKQLQSTTSILDVKGAQTKCPPARPCPLLDLGRCWACTREHPPRPSSRLPVVAMVGLSAASSHGQWGPDPLLGPAAEQEGDDARQIGVRRRCAAESVGAGTIVRVVYVVASSALRWHCSSYKYTSTHNAHLSRSRSKSFSGTTSSR